MLSSVRQPSLHTLYCHPGTRVVWTVLIIGACFLLLLVVLCPVLMWLHSRRANAHAPKRATNTVAIMFTDIESSTKLWAKFPNLMPDIMDTHHRLIRQLIKKHGCYEVVPRLVLTHE